MGITLFTLQGSSLLTNKCSSIAPCLLTRGIVSMNVTRPRPIHKVLNYYRNHFDCPSFSPIQIVIHLVITACCSYLCAAPPSCLVLLILRQLGHLVKAQAGITSVFPCRIVAQWTLLLCSWFVSRDSVSRRLITFSFDSHIPCVRLFSNRTTVNIYGYLHSATPTQEKRFELEWHFSCVITSPVIITWLDTSRGRTITTSFLGRLLE